jgi:D-alanine transaminase
LTAVTAHDDSPVTLDGRLMRADEASIAVTDEALIRGDGAFDAFPVRDGRPFAGAAHLDRLERSCEALMLPCPRTQTPRRRRGVPRLDRAPGATDRRDRRDRSRLGARAADAGGAGHHRAGDGRRVDRLIGAPTTTITVSRTVP